jgi:hypothetical protein
MTSLWPGQTRKRGSIPGKGRRSSHLEIVQTGPGTHWIPHAVFAKLKRPRREADHLTPLTVEVKNVIPPTLS